MRGLTFVLTLLLAWVSSLHRVLATSADCFSPRPGSADRSGVRLKVVRRSWLSHDVVSTIAEIVLKEFLGFTVERSFQSDESLADWGEEMASGRVDIDIEHWGDAGQQWHDQYREYVLDRQEVYDAGFIGYSGRSGLYVLQAALDHKPLADYYRFFQNATDVVHSDLLKFKSTRLPYFLGSSFPVCDVTAHSWCGTDEFEGYWPSPTCLEMEHPEDCLEVLHTIPEWDTGYFEQLVRNHNIAAVFGYYGLDMADQLKELASSGQQPVFYWWEPDPLLLEVQAMRISFPSHTIGCDRANNRDANTGPVTCDYGRTMLGKFVSRRVREWAPEAMYFISRFELLQNDINSLIERAVSMSQSEDAMHNLACSYVHERIDAFRLFAPTCITNPPYPVKDGDLILNAATLECESAIVYQTTDPTFCFSEGNRPGLVDRSDRTVKLVRREWVSHTLATILAEVVLRDYLGFNVELVYNTRSADFQFGEEMVRGDYHVDMEQWQANPGSNNDREYIRTGRVLNVGSLGFAGREGLYIRREAAARFPMLEYWKTYLNASNVQAAGLVTHANSPLQSVIGDSFPICPDTRDLDTCSTGDLEGYWAPPQCQGDPGRCLEIVSSAPPWDTSYAEQLVKNLRLEAVVAYYGIDGMIDVIMGQAGSASASPFFWYEPEPVIAMVDAVRISFPDYYYGCDWNNTYNPNTGVIECDWPPTDLVKLAAPIVKNSMQEAYHALERITIYSEMLNQLFVLPGSSSEAVCSFIANNSHVMREWAPDCLVRPPDQVRVNDTVFFPNELQCKPLVCERNQVLRYEEQFHTFYCTECGLGQVPNSDQRSCVDCELGKEADAATGECYACAPGRSAASRGRCTPCPAGWFSNGGVSSVCTPCPLGTTSLEESSTCAACPEGKFSGVRGDACADCAPGSFAAHNMSSACEACEVGWYTAEMAATSCNRCGQGKQTVSSFSTMQRLDLHGETQVSYVVGSDSEEHCGCERGWRSDENGECVQCGEGMDCPGLGEVFIQRGYFSKAYPEISVFKCHGADGRCPGGEPGQTCALGRHGITCAECGNMMMPSGDECIPCSGQDKIPFIMFILVSVVVLIALDAFTASALGKNQNFTVLFISIAMGQLVTTLQVMSVVSFMALPWEDPFKSVLDIVTIIAIDIEVLRVGCIGNLNSPQRYVTKLGMLLIAVVAICVIHIVRRGMHRLRRDTQARLKTFWSLVASLSAFLMVFYITVGSAVLQPLQCKEHPNGLWTVWEYQSVICWESRDHMVMLLIALLAFILVPVGFLVFIICVLMQIPARMRKGDVRFVRTFAFLSFRFKPGMHWFLIVHMVKSLLIACCIVIPDTLLEIVSLVVILVFSWGITLLYRPWRMLQAELLDTALTVTLLMIVVIAAFYVETSAKNFRTLSWICFLLLMSVLQSLVTVICINLYHKYLRPVKRFEFFLCHHKASSGAFTRLLQMSLLESPKITGHVFIDCDHLDNLDNLFEFIRSETKTVVLVVTTGIFSRPWCIGEMTTARLEKVPTISLTLPSSKLPDDDFISHVMSEGLGNSEILVEVGIDMAMVQATLSWVHFLPQVAVDRRINLEGMTQIAHKLLQCELSPGGLYDSERAGKKLQVWNTVTHIVSLNRLSSGNSRFVSGHISHQGTMPSHGAYMVYDSENMDACAACYVLQKMLIPMYSGEEDSIPFAVESVTDIPEGSGATGIVVCTNGAIENPLCLQMIAKASVNKHTAYPVLAEATFRFPPQDVLQWLQSLNLNPVLLSDFEQQLAALSITSLFKEIATAFQPNSASFSVLQVSAQEVHRRMVSLRSRMQRSNTSGQQLASKLLSSLSGVDAIQPIPTTPTVASAPVDLADFGMSSPKLPAEFFVMTDEDAKCPACGERFASIAACRSHVAKVSTCRNWILAYDEVPVDGRAKDVVVCKGDELPQPKALMSEIFQIPKPPSTKPPSLSL